jgi:hypothetical protein
MLSGIAVSASMTYLSEKFSPSLKVIPILLIILGISLPALQQESFFQGSSSMANRLMYKKEPFLESLVVAKYIRNHSSPADTIAVLGSEPQIYFYSGRKSATGHIYMYGLTERQVYASEMRKEMIQEVESAKPRYVVYVNVYSSWLTHADSTNLYVLNWAKIYLGDHYTVTGAIKSRGNLELVKNEKFNDKWLAADYTMLILEKNSDEREKPSVH